MTQHGPLAPDSPHTHSGGSQEPEHIDMGRSIAILVGSLLAFAAVVVWAVLILHQNERAILPGGWPAPPAEIGRAEIGIVNQKMFDLDNRAERRMERLQDELTSYGWVDAKQGTVHIPIDEAMKAFLAEQAQ